MRDTARLKCRKDENFYDDEDDDEVQQQHKYILVSTEIDSDQSWIKVLCGDVYRLPAGPDSEFLSDFSKFLSDLVLRTDKVITVGDFNIHVENDASETASSQFLGFSQQINQPTQF